MSVGQPNATRPDVTASVEPHFQNVWRGFDPEQVRSHLSQVTGRLEDLESRLGRTQRLLEEARREADLARTTVGLGSHEGVSSHVVDLVRRFGQDVEGLRREAEAEATGIVAEARSEAARLRMQMQVEEQEALAHTEEMLRATREQADRLQRELEPVRDAMLTQIREMRDRLANTVRELDQVLNRQPSEEPVVVIGEAEEGPSMSERVPVRDQETPSELGTQR